MNWNSAVYRIDIVCNRYPDINNIKIYMQKHCIFYIYIIRVYKLCC